MERSTNQAERQASPLTFRASCAQVKTAHTPIDAGFRPCYQATIEARGEHGEDVVLTLQTFEPIAIDAAFDIEVRPIPSMADAPGRLIPTDDIRGSVLAGTHLDTCTFTHEGEA